MRFFCNRYPQLNVHNLGVRFRGGVYETDDPDIAEALVESDLPITWEGELPTREPLAYADMPYNDLRQLAGERGIEGVGNMKKDDLIAKLEALDGEADGDDNGVRDDE